MESYNQNILIDHLNLYLKFEGRSLQLNYGYCHGLSLYWLHHIANNKNEYFNKLIKKIISANTASDFKKIRHQCEKFISHIEWLQHSCNYQSKIQQTNINTLLEVQNMKSISLLFNRKQLKFIIQNSLNPHVMMTLSNINHTIGLYKKDNIYYLYDPNFNSGIPYSTQHIQSIINMIINQFYKHEHNPKHSLPITIGIASDKPIPDKYIRKIQQEAFTINPYINKLGCNSISPLYFAINENRFEDLKNLLECNANPNLFSKGGFTPIMYSVKRGHYEITKELILFGANVNLADPLKNKTPLHYSIKKKHTKISKLLLDSGADPFSETKSGLSPLDIAIFNCDWNSVTLLLMYVKNLNDLSDHYKRQIAINKKNILLSLKELEPHFKHQKEKIVIFNNHLHHSFSFFYILKTKCEEKIKPSNYVRKQYIYLP